MTHLLTGWRPYAALILLCLALYLPGQGALPPMDRDEARYAQASKQMLETKDYITIWFQDTPRHKKPAGIYWLQASAAHLFGGPEDATIRAYRLPSLLAAIGAVLLTFAFGSSLFGPAAAFLGAGLLAGSVMLTTEAHLAKTDAALLLTTVMVLGALGRFYMAAKAGTKQPGVWTGLSIWVGLGVGILIKGPLVPLIAVLTYVSLSIADRSWSWVRTTRPVLGLLVVVALVGPWFNAIQQATGGDFASEAIGKDLIPKLLGGQEAHGAWPGYYLLLATLTLWPGSLFLWPALARAWKTRQAAAVRFCLAWAVPSWIVFELVPTKLPHYTLPTYPALTLLIGVALLSVGDERLFTHWTARAFAVVWGVVSLALIGVTVWAPLHYGDGFSLWSIPALLGGAFATVWGLKHFWTAQLGRAAIGMVLGGVVLLAPTFAGVAPSLTDMMLSPRAAALVRQQAPDTNWPVAVAEYHEPSLVFLLGTGTQLTDGAGAASYIMTNDGAVALVGEREEPGFQETLSKAGRRARMLGQVSGLNYSRGRPTTLRLYRLER